MARSSRPEGGGSSASEAYPDRCNGANRKSNRKGWVRVSQYEVIGIVLGVIIFGVILLAGLLVGKREHA